jgi:hypothetical protein
MLQCPFVKEGIMAGEDIIMLSQKDLKRLHVIEKVREGTVKQVSAAQTLSLSTRQIRRIVSRISKEGSQGVVHRSRGKPSNRRYSDTVKSRSIALYRQRYLGFGPTLAAEKLSESHGIEITDETLRKWLIASGDWRKARKRTLHRQWRQRKQHYGAMVQMDGSHHDWFEGRGPRCVLMGYIDDATGRAFGRFYAYEGTIPAMDSFTRYLRKYGIPLSLYLDKHGAYKSKGKPTLEEELQGIGPLSEFERALRELGVEVIHANSPQAKGRIERLFGTLQDRLVKEMRLRDIKSIEEANTFLDQYWPAYNRRFAVSPVSGEDFHRDISKGLNLNDIFCIKTKRTLRNDFTVAHNRKLYQVQSHIRASAVIVYDRLDGSMAITHKDRPVQFVEIASRPLKEKKEPLQVHRKIYHPTKHDYWKNLKFGKHRHEQGHLIGSLP